MVKMFQKIILLIAVITVTAHSVFPHIHLDDIMAFTEGHHHEQSADKHHHDDNDNSSDDQHNLFSLAQLDESFIPAIGKVKALELPSEYQPVIYISLVSEIVIYPTKTQFGWHIEYPPPVDYLYNLPSRAPPAVV